MPGATNLPEAGDAAPPRAIRKFTLGLRLEPCVQVRVEADGEGIDLFPSFPFGDALDYLIRGTVALMEGAPLSRFSWQDEPGEYRWFLQREEGILTVEILEFGDCFSTDPDERGAVIFSGRCWLLRFATQVKGQFHQLLNQYGASGYRALWRHEFPMAQFDRLTQLIAERKATSDGSRGQTS